MKTLFLFSWIIFFTIQNHLSFCQTKKYLVVIGNEKIQNLQSKKGLSSSSPNDVLLPETPLKFEDTKANAILMDELGKEYEIKYRADKPNPTVKDVLFAIVDKPIKGSRGGFPFVADLGTYFGTDFFYIIGNQLKIRLGKRYKMEKNDFLGVMFLGNKIKPFPFKGDTIIIAKENLKDAVSSDTVQIYRTIKSGQDVVFEELMTFYPIFLNENELKATFTKWAKIADKQGYIYEKRKDYFVKQFLKFFGNTDELLLEDWLLKNNFLKK